MRIAWILTRSQDGLYRVIDGGVDLENVGGTSSFDAGQYAYIANNSSVR